MKKIKRLGLLLMLGRRLVLCMELKKNYSLKSILIAKKKKRKESHYSAEMLHCFSEVRFPRQQVTNKA